MIKTTAIGLVFATAASAMTPDASAQTSASRAQIAQAAPSDVSAQSRRPRRPRVRIYREDDRGVYPSYYPGPNAVRDCTVTYVQEFRPSGTVIVPHMNCFWRRG